MKKKEKAVLNEWTEIRLLKESESCRVTLCETADGSKYVIKQYRREFANQARNEFLFLQTVRAEHVLQAVEFIPDEEPRIVMSYLEGEMVTMDTVQALGEPDTLFARLAFDIAQIHAFGICINDLKPENLILKDKALHIIDFGMATINLYFDRYYRGTLAYAAAEKVLRQTNHFAGDIFALGMTCFYCKHGKTILEYVGETEYMKLLINPEQWQKQVDLLETDPIIKSMLKYNAGERPTALEITGRFAARCNLKLKGLEKALVESYVFKCQMQAVEILYKKKVVQCNFADEPQRIESLFALSCETNGTKLLTLDESLFLTQPDEFFKPFPVGYRDNNVYQSRFIEWLNEQPITILLRRNRQIKPTGFFDEIVSNTSARQLWIDHDSELKPVSQHELNDLLQSIPTLDKKKVEIRKKVSNGKPLLIRMLLLQIVQSNAKVLDNNDLIDFLAWIDISIPIVLIEQVWDNWHILVHDALLKRKIAIDGNIIRSEAKSQDKHQIDEVLADRIIDIAVKSNFINIAGEASYLLGNLAQALKHWSLYVDDLIKNQYFVSAYEFISQVNTRIPEIPFELKKKQAFLARICGHFNESYALYQLLLNDSEGLMKAVLSVDQAIVLQSLNKNEAAIQAYKNAIDLFRIHKDNKGLLRALNNLGVVFFELKRYAEAEQVFNDVLNEARQFDNIQFETISYINLSDIQLKRGEWKRVLYYAEKAINITHTNQKWNLYINASTIAARAYFALGETERAFSLFEQIYNNPKAAENTLQYQETIAWLIHYAEIYHTVDTDLLVQRLSFSDSSLHDILMRELFFFYISRQHYLQAYKYLQSLAEVSILKAFFDSDTATMIERLKELKMQSEIDSYVYYLSQFYRLFPKEASFHLPAEIQEAWDLYMYHPLQNIRSEINRSIMGFEDWDRFITKIDTAETSDEAVKLILDKLICSVQADKYAYLENRNGSLVPVFAIDKQGNPISDSRLFLSQTLLENITQTPGYVYLYPAYNYVSVNTNSSALGLGISTVIGYSEYQDEKLAGVFYCDKNDGMEFDSSMQAQAKLLFYIAHKTLTNLNARQNKAYAMEVTELDVFEPSAHQMIGNSKAMQEIYARIDLVAGYDVNVLITGPTGSGKELVARAIHKQYIEKYKGLSKSPFIAVNCAAIPEQLLESELFGYKKGAFTGAYNDKKGKILSADKGTLFLDEIGEMPMLLQTKLLRVIQERIVAPLGSEAEYPVNVRIIAATNQNLEERVTQNLFRSDLYYRLKVVTIELPSLSERKEDIPLIAMFYIKKFNEKFRKKIMGIHPAAIQYLQSKIWNGNVRELENELERAVLLCNREFLGIEDFSADSDTSSGSIFRNLPLEWQDFKEYKQRIADELDKRYIKQLLFESGNNIMSASKLGNLERMQIYRLMKKNDEN